MAIKIHPIQERLRHGKNIPRVKEKPHVVETPEEKGKFRGLCNRSACLAPGAVFYNHGNSAYYCRECALAIHDASMMNLDWMRRRMIELENDQTHLALPDDEIETNEDIEQWANRYAEAKMAKQWAHWQNNLEAQKFI